MKKDDLNDEIKGENEAARLHIFFFFSGVCDLNYGVVNLFIEALRQTNSVLCIARAAMREHMALSLLVRYGL